MIVGAWAEDEGVPAAIIAWLILSFSRSLRPVPAGVLRTVYARRVFLAEIGVSGTKKKPSKHCV